MNTCVNQELGELSQVSFSDAGADPWAVVIVDFDAHLADVAVESSWWPQDVAFFTICQFIQFIEQVA